MSADAGAYEYLAGRGGVVSPDDPLAVIEQTARAYDIRWLALERAHIVPALVPVLDGSLHPSWLAGPLITVESPTGTQPAAALFAVCLEPGQAGCPQ